ncbi:MAG TPA: sigma-70 family RNA polymerase sigma factor [Nannocystaceae bacterium]|nr:sigma-70 family RNA polymerase sigma factor [Nannocystaceae bacterium]
MGSERAAVATWSLASDGELVAAIARGDSAALAALYDRHAALLLAVAARILGPHAAEDLVHDVLVEAWQRAATYDPARGSVRAWLLLRLRSRALDRCRRNQRRPSEPIDRAAELGDPDVPDPLNRLEQARARDALGALTPNQREILELAYFTGMTMAEIAEHLGIPIGTVKSRTSAALGRLREALQAPRGGAS